MQKTWFDHIMVGYSNLQEGITWIKENMGVTPAYGGSHPGRGTQNILLSLSDRSYFELIVPDPAQPPTPFSAALRQLADPKLITWAAATASISRIAHTLEDRSIAFDPVRQGSRRTPDNNLL